VLIGKHAYEFHLKNIQQSYSIGEASYNIRNENKTFPDLMLHLIRGEIDISSILFDMYSNEICKDEIFDTFKVVKKYCPMCNFMK
jgi:hypothetical protein